MQKIIPSMFDLSFKKFVTPQLASFVFVMAVIMSGVCALMALNAPFGYVVAPILFISSVVFARVAIEVMLAVFQIARYTAETARRGRVSNADSETDLSA